MASPLHFLFTFFSLLVLVSSVSESDVSSVSESAKRATSPVFKPNAFVLQVNKDSATGLHVTKIQKRTPSLLVPLAVDLNGQFVWVTCEKNYLSSTYRAPKCHSTQCAKANSQYCHTCSSRQVGPGCHNNTCALSTVNPVTQKMAMGELAQDALYLQSTQGANPGPRVTFPNFLFSCAPAWLLQYGLPKNVQGVVGLGHAPISLPTQVSSHFGTQPTFATCLTTMGGNGVIFFGKGPYNMINGVDVSKNLEYTPLIISPRGEYFIQVTSIKVNQKLVAINPSLLKPQKGAGAFRGTTMISTISPYTTLEQSIYQTLIQFYAKQFTKTPQVKPIAPFGLCFNGQNVGRTKAGYDVPTIDLVLENGNTKWTIYGSNLMVQPQPGVLCVGIVDGGVKPKAPIVIGAYQLEDNILQFDLARSRLGFGNAPFKGTTCGNFNFTSSTY